jgi:hypothetical protein
MKTRWSKSSVFYLQRACRSATIVVFAEDQSRSAPDLHTALGPFFPPSALDGLLVHGWTTVHFSEKEANLVHVAPLWRSLYNGRDEYL